MTDSEKTRRRVRKHFSGKATREPLVIGEGATTHLLTASVKSADPLHAERLVAAIDAFYKGATFEYMTYKAIQRLRKTRADLIVYAHDLTRRKESTQ